MRSSGLDYRDWLGNEYADRAAKSAAASARIKVEDRKVLKQVHECVEGVAMWVAAVGSSMGGEDTTHRKAKPNRPAPKAEKRMVAARLECDLRGPPGHQWCTRCRWSRRQSECPGDITNPVLEINNQLLKKHVLVKLWTERGGPHEGYAIHHVYGLWHGGNVQAFDFQQG
eukprot:9498127-Pyramimonas_sp.AAC.2